MAHIERVLASGAELGSPRITVNSVAPGLTDTAAIVPAERPATEGGSRASIADHNMTLIVCRLIVVKNERWGCARFLYQSSIRRVRAKIA